MQKKLLAGVASVTLAATLAACSGGGEQAATTGPVNILVVQNTNQIPITDMQWAKDLATDTGCEINWQSVNDNAWSQQKNPSLAAGDVPDMAIRAIQPGDAVQFPDLFENIADHLDKLPNVEAFFKEKPDARKLVEDSDGKIFALPSSRGKGYAGSGQHMMINKKWLDKLGLQIPKTWDELTNVLKAFKTQDPNGNGKADEIPMNIHGIGTGGFGWFSPMLLLNSTGIVTQFNKGPSAQGIYVKDGKVGNYLITDQYKQVITYLHDLMAQGLVPKDALTKDDSAYGADIVNDGKTAKTGVNFGWSLQDFGDLKDEYVAMPAPAATADMSPSDVVWDGSDNELESGKLSVAAKSAGNECVWKITDALYSEKYSMQQFSGSFGEYLTDDGNKTYTMTEAYKKAWADGKDPGLSDRLAGWIPDEVTLKGDWNRDDLRQVDDVYKQQYANYDHTKDMMPDYVRLTADDETAVSNVNSAVLNYAMQQASKWIMQGGIDQEWDKYVSQLKSLGIDDNTAKWQAAYDRYVK